MKSRLEKVYGKLPNQKVSLKKVELSLISNIEELTKEAEDKRNVLDNQMLEFYKDLIRAIEKASVMSSSYSDFVNVISLLEDKTIALEDAFNELGVNPQLDILDNATSAINTAIDINEEYDRTSKTYDIVNSNI